MTLVDETLASSSEDRWFEIERRQHLIIGLCPDLPGMGCWNREKHRFEGFEADLARCLTEELLGSADMAEYSSVPTGEQIRHIWSAVAPAERLPRIVKGELDMVLSQLTITAERLELVDFSDPYLVAYEAVLVPARSNTQTLDDLRGKTVAVAEDTASFHRYSKLHPEINLVITTKESDGIFLLLAGDVDGMANDNVNLEGLLASLPKSDSQRIREIDVASAFDPKPFGVCIKKDNPIFMAKLNRAIATLKQNGVIARLFEASRQF